MAATVNRYWVRVVSSSGFLIRQLYFVMGFTSTELNQWEVVSSFIKAQKARTLPFIIKASWSRSDDGKRRGEARLPSRVSGIDIRGSMCRRSSTGDF